MSDFIVFDVDAQSCLKSGVDKLCKAVSMTMGPRGKLALIERQGKPPHLTKDGATVAKNLFLGDRTEAMGAALLRQASENTAEVAGDGSTTSTVLAAEIYNKASQALQTGVLSPSEMCKALQDKSEEIISHLISKSKQVNSNEEIEQVATISANGDKYIGELIAKAMTEVGSSGLVTVEKSKTTSTDLNLVRGIKIDRGYISPYFINSPDKSKCILDDPFVLIVDNKIQSLTQLLPVLEKMHQTKKPVFIIANDFDPEAIQSLLANVTKGILEVCIIRSPFYGEKRAQILDDLSKTLGTKVITDLDEKQIDSINISDLGTCKKIEVSREETLFVECKTEEFDKDSSRTRRILNYLRSEIDGFDQLSEQDRKTLYQERVEEIQDFNNEVEQYVMKMDKLLKDKGINTVSVIGEQSGNFGDNFDYMYKLAGLEIRTDINEDNIHLFSGLRNSQGEFGFDSGLGTTTARKVNAQKIYDQGVANFAKMSLGFNEAGVNPSVMRGKDNEVFMATDYNKMISDLLADMQDDGMLTVKDGEVARFNENLANLMQHKAHMSESDLDLINQIKELVDTQKRLTSELMSENSSG